MKWNWNVPSDWAFVLHDWSRTPKLYSMYTCSFRELGLEVKIQGNVYTKGFHWICAG